MPKHSRLTLEELLAKGPTEEIRQKLLEEEAMMRKQRPPHWATTIYRPRAMLRARVLGEISQEELDKFLAKFYSEIRKRKVGR